MKKTCVIEVPVYCTKISGQRGAEQRGVEHEQAERGGVLQPVDAEADEEHQAERRQHQDDRAVAAHHHFAERGQAGDAAPTMRIASPPEA